MADPIYCPLLFGAPCMKPEVWAAWWQAILSATAIVAAYKIAAHQRKLELADRHQAETARARSFALVVLREMKTLRERLRDNQERTADAIDTQTQLQVQTAFIPQALWDNVEKMHILGKASTPVIDCIYRLQESRKHFLPGVCEIPREEVAVYLKHIEAAFASADDAIAQLNELLS